MSATTGRMSRADAQYILSALQPVLREFSSPDASGETLQEVADCSALRAQLQDALDRGEAPDTRAIRSLRARLADLQFSRFTNSLDTPPRVTSAAVVTLYGLQAYDTTHAATLAAMQIHGEYAPELVRLQDSSHVSTATLTGTRYVFTSHTP